MEESAEKRREQLTAMRDEAYLAAHDEGVAVSTPPLTPGSTFPLNAHSRDDPPRFLYYTDPLTSFASQKKNKKQKLNNYTGASLAPSPPSPLCRPNSYDSHVGRFHTPIPTADYQHGSAKLNPSSTPPRTFTSPGPAKCGGILTPSSSSHNNTPFLSGFVPGGPEHVVQTTFHSPEQSSAYHPNDDGGRGGYVENSYHNSHGISSFLANSPTQWWGRGKGMKGERNQGANQSWWSFHGQTPGRSRGSGSQKSHGYPDQSAVTNPECFVNASMLNDPWKDLDPVLLETEEYRMNSCSHDWLPKSVSERKTFPSTKAVIFSASGPSLAEYLENAFSDAAEGPS